jgi:YidC/Oxa1 family membrane protein insertase
MKAGRGSLALDKDEWMKESGRFTLAILLMIVVIFGSNRLFRPEQPPVERAPAELLSEPQQQGSPITGLPDAEGTASPGVEDGMTTATLGAATATASVDARADTVVVESPLYRYSFTTRGAGVIGAELLQYESFTGEGTVDLAPEIGGGLIGYQVRIGDRLIDLGSVDFQPETTGTIELAAGDAPETLWFSHHDDASGVSIRIGYTFSPDDYLVQVQGAIVDPAQIGN